MKDRGMVKWQPFAALSGHDDYVSNVMSRRVRKEMPILSEDRIQEIEYSLCEAIVGNFPVKIKYYDNGSFFEKNCKIVTIDTLNKLIYLDINIVLTFEQIIEISS